MGKDCMEAASAWLCRECWSCSVLTFRSVSCTLQDPAKALYWYTKAAMGGDCSAQLRVGQFYQKGIGVPVDCGKAVRIPLNTTRGAARRLAHTPSVFCCPSPAPLPCKLLSLPS